MSRTERLFELIQALRRRRRPVTGRELAAEMSVSLRTVYRDLRTLTAQGAPIEGERGMGFILRPGFMLPPLMFRDEEIEALVLGARWVSQQPDQALAKAAQDAVARISAVLPEKLKDRAESAGLYPAQAVPSAFDVVDAGILRQAIRLERKLSIVYRDDRGRRTKRTIWPLALAFFERVRVLVAWCEMRTDYRHFRTDRIVSAAITDELLPRRRRLLLREWHKKEGIPEDEI